MATTTFVDNVTQTAADWFNDVDRLQYDILNDPADLAALVATLGATNWTITGNLSVQGNTTIGNASGDSLTFHPNAWTLSNAVTVTGTWANLGTVTTVDINGGTIDGAVIGGSSAAAGSFTTLSATTDFSVTAPLVDVYFTSSTGTNRSNIRFVNTGGSYLVGAEDSVGGSFGATAYDGAFYVPSGKGFSVVVAGTGVVQRTTSTGLAVTGAISSTTEVSAVEFQLTGIGSFSQGSLYLNATHGLIVGGKAGSTNDVYITNSGGTAAITVPTGTANVGIGGNLTVSGGTITTGNTTPLALTTGGGTVLDLRYVASSVNYLQIVPSAATGANVILRASGSDTNVTLYYDSQGTGSHNFRTGNAGGNGIQVSVLNTVSADRYITLTGSNGGNPTISVSAGELALGTNAWTLGTANVVSPTSPNRTLTVTIGGVTYYIAAKTTND